MLRLFVKLMVNAVAVLITAYLLSGVMVHSFLGALVVAGVLSLLNTFVKPLLIVLTIPFTIFTFGLFLMVINAVMILLAGAIVPGFEVQGFWWALGFSIIMSLISSILSLLLPTSLRKNNIRVRIDRRYEE